VRSSPPDADSNVTGTAAPQPVDVLKAPTTAARPGCPRCSPAASADRRDRSRAHNHLGHPAAVVGTRARTGRGRDCPHRPRRHGAPAFALRVWRFLLFVAWCGWSDDRRKARPRERRAPAATASAERSGGGPARRRCARGAGACLRTDTRCERAGTAPVTEPSLRSPAAPVGAAGRVRHTERTLHREPQPPGRAAGALIAAAAARAERVRASTTSSSAQAPSARDVHGAHSPRDG